MTSEIVADILLILVISAVIYAILSLVNRGKKKSADNAARPDAAPAEEDSADSTQDHNA